MKKLLSLTATIALVLGVIPVLVWSQDVPNPSIDVKKMVSSDGINWEDADDPTGPEVVVGGDVYFKFVVTNTGNRTLTDITLKDSVFDTSGCTLVDPLAAGASFECKIGPFEANYGQHANTATATGKHYVILGFPFYIPAEDTDKAHYIGVEIGVEADGVYEACSLGFWKSHPGDWPDEYDPDVYTVGDVFELPPTDLDDLADHLLMEALSYKGKRSGTPKLAKEVQAAKILLRNAVAALLNAASGFNLYPLSEEAIKTQVNGALGSGVRKTMLGLNEELDGYNDGLCPPEDEGEPQLAPGKHNTLSTTWGKIKAR